MGTNLRQHTFDMDTQLSLLRRFLKLRHVSLNLRSRILKYAEYRHHTYKDQIQASDVKLLRVLSKPLQHELMSESYVPVLVKHPLFAYYEQKDHNAMVRVCAEAVT